ncbi:MAG: HAD-IC family P-type ATPase, partial [Bacilli bacterium]|nr:HAD-IC family P-type ATPase [Bacilli bacterium]
MSKHYQQMNEDEIFEALSTSKLGLDNKEATKRIQKYGLNELPKKEKDSVLKIFLMQFFNAITIIMILAAILSIFIKEYTDAIAIIFIIIVDAIMGTIQELKANKSAEALANMIKVKVDVIRNGHEKHIDASSLVPGDIVLLSSGCKVSADARLISASNLCINESILTGESIESTKNAFVSDEVKAISDSKNMVYAGTSVITGRGICVVVGTGSNTEIGKIAKKVNETKDAPSPLTIRMNKFTKQISILIVIVSIFLIALMLIKGFKIDEIFMSIVSLAVSAMPEGLPLALTLALTIGSSRMSNRNVIAKKLNAVESLGSCTVIASDKTGTLTVNEQTAKRILLPNGSMYKINGTGYYDDGKVIGDKEYIERVKEISLMGFLNNEAGIECVDNIWTSYGDSIDIAFLTLARKTGVDKNKNEIVGRIPYESENKYSAVFYKENENIKVTAKGAIDTIIELCDEMYDGNKIVKINKDTILKQNEELASYGYRVIALAVNETNKFQNKDFYEKKDIPKLIFLGLIAFIDPIREEVKNSIKKCKKACIRVLMITGDHPLTAYSIAKELDIANSNSQVADGDMIAKELEKGPVSFDKFIETKTVYTRVTPLQKLEIVDALKRNGDFVAVTGDGVNDSPAIKSANIGVAMGSGSDVAKETSDMIIIDDNFMSIVFGIEEGRTAYANIRKVIYMLISCGLAEVLFFVLSIFTNLPMPLVAVQLLWLNLVTDGLQDLALSFEKEEDGIMNDKPRDPKESVFDKLLTNEILLSGIFMGILVYIVW